MKCIIELDFEKFKYSIFISYFRYFSTLHNELLERIPKSFLIMGAIFAILQIIGLILITEVKVEEDQPKSESIGTDSVDLAIESDKVDPKSYINSIGVKYVNKIEKTLLN